MIVLYEFGSETSFASSGEQQVVWHDLVAEKVEAVDGLGKDGRL